MKANLFSCFAAKSNKPETIELTTFDKVKKVFIDRATDKKLAKQNAQLVKNLTGRYDHKLTKEQKTFIGKHKEEFHEVFKAVTVDFGNEPTDENIRKVAYALMYDKSHNPASSIKSRGGEAIYAAIKEQFPNDTDKVHAIFYRLLQTNYKKNYFHVVGVKESGYKTRIKLDAIAIIFGIDDANRVEEPQQQVSALLGNEKPTSHLDSLFGEREHNPLEFAQDKFAVKDSKMEIVDKIEPQHKSIAPVVSLDEQDDPELQAALRLSLTENHAKKPNFTTAIEVRGGMEEGMSTTVLEVKHEVFTPKSFRKDAQTPIGYGTLSEVAKATKAKAETKSALAKWQPMFSKAGCYDAYQFEQLDDQSFVKDLCRPGLNPVISVILDGKKFELHFPQRSKNSEVEFEHEYMYSLNASSKDIIDAIIGMPDNKLFKAQKAKNSGLELSAFNSELAQYLSTVASDKVDRLYDLIKIATHQDVGIYIKDAFMASIMYDDVRSSESGMYYPVNYKYNKSIDLDRMSVDYKQTEFDITIPFKEGSSRKKLGDFSFKVEQSDESGIMPGILEDGFTITDIFYDETSSGKPVQIFSYERAVLGKQLEAIDKEIDYITTGNRRADIMKQIAQIKTDNPMSDDSKQIVDILKDEINALNRQPSGASLEEKEEILSKIEGYANQITKLDGGVSALEVKLVDLGDGENSPVLKTLRDKRTLIANEINRIDTGISVEQFEHLGTLRKDLLAIQKIIEDMTIWGGEDGKGMLRVKLKSKISEASLDEKKIFETRLANLERLSQTDMQELLEELRGEEKAYISEITKLEAAIGVA